MAKYFLGLLEIPSSTDPCLAKSRPGVSNAF